MDDRFDEFHDDFDEYDLGDDETDGDGIMAESEDGSWDGPSWQDWMIIGPLAESLASEKRERERIRRENEADDSWDVINRKW